MPIIKSAIKRMHQTSRHRARNQGNKRSLRAEMKILSAAIEAKDSKKAADQLKKVQSKLDTAVKKNLLKKNTAARKMSALTSSVKALGVAPAPAAKKTSVKAKTAPKAKVQPAAKKPAAKKASPKKK